MSGLNRPWFARRAAENTQRTTEMSKTDLCGPLCVLRGSPCETLNPTVQIVLSGNAS